MVYTTYTSEPYNDGIRVAVSFEATYTENGEKKTVTKNDWQEWMQAQSYDLTTWGDPTKTNVDEGGIEWILNKDPEATIKITKIRLDNFDKLDKPKEQGGVSIPVDYKFTSATVNNKEITEITATGHSATLYNGSFTVKNKDAQACNIARFDIPEEYRGGYVRIDFGKEPEQNWGLNLAFEKAPGEGCGGWTDINNYNKKVGTSRYYKIPEEAATMNPQIWKNTDDNQSWTIDIDGFYLTTGFDYSQVYTDEYFPLESEKMHLDFWGANNTFDNATKTITFEGSACRVGWDFKPGINPEEYKYMVIVTNPNTPGYVDFRTKVNGKETVYVPNNGNSEAYHLEANDNYFTWKLGEGKLIEDNESKGELEMSEVSSIDAFSFWLGFGVSSTSLPLSSVFLTNVEPNWANPEARTTTSGNYGTVCLPYPAVCTNGYVYTITGKDAEGSTLYLEPYNGVMSPGMPYIYKSIGEGVKFYQIESEDAKADEALTYNGLVGCFNTTTQGDNYYALGSNNQWVKMDANVTFKNRAYLDLNNVPTLEEEEPSVANVAMRVIPGTTDIEAVQQDETTDDQAIYSLSGIRVDDGAKLGRGIYIRGGKKFIVK